RTIKVMGTKGEIVGDDSKNEIEYQLFDTNEKIVINPKVVIGGHGGGDTGLMKDFVSLMLLKEGEALTSADKSVQSHMMAFAAEESRMKDEIIIMEDYCNEF